MNITSKFNTERKGRIYPLYTEIASFQKDTIRLLLAYIDAKTEQDKEAVNKIKKELGQLMLKMD